jgi:hypothetical protein
MGREHTEGVAPERIERTPVRIRGPIARALMASVATASSMRDFDPRFCRIPLIGHRAVLAVKFRDAVKAVSHPLHISTFRRREQMKITTLAVGLMLFVGSAAVASAQEKTTHKKVRTISGCLSKSDDANEYLLTTAGGATWEVKSDAVNLGEHVGHAVAITGTVRNATMHGMKEDAKQEAKEHGMDKGAKEHGHLEATGIKMVAESCKK